MAKDVSGTKDKRRSKRNRQTLSWASAPVQTMRSFIGIVTDNGAAVLFGRTMDGGALMVQVLNGDDRYKEYITTYSDIVPVLADIVEEFVSQELADLLMEADK